jgi:hypothetical protein
MLIDFMTSGMRSSSIQVWSYDAARRRQGHEEAAATSERHIRAAVPP